MHTIRLLGRPLIERDGRPIPPPRGHKPWMLLAHLLLAPDPSTRRRLASLLFEEAADPLGALRWSLSELRRALDGALALAGDPVQTVLGPDVRIDVSVVLSGRPDDDDLAHLGGTLLEGVAGGSPAYEAWLGAQRQRLASACLVLLHERALEALAFGRPEAAARLASLAIELDRYDADGHAVLVRALAAGGDVGGAQRQAARCTDLFRRDLGCDPPLAVIAAAATPGRVTGRDGVPPSSAAARSLLDAGQASLSAGATALGLDQLRRAVEVAVAAGDRPLAAATKVALASGRIHATGARGADVAGLLHDGLAVARAGGDEQTAATACLELAFLGIQLGHVGRVEDWLRQAEGCATGSREQARVLGLRGMALTDFAHHAPALDVLRHSIDLAAQAGDERQVAWSRSMLGRVHSLCGEPSQAALVLDRAIDGLHRTGWTAFLPWAEAFRAEAAIDLGDLDLARELLDHAWVMSVEADDHCWIATVARGLGRRAAAIGDVGQALRWIDTGLQPSTWYLWPRAHLLDAGCQVAATGDPVVAARWAAELGRLAARGGMRDHVVRARLHRARLGELDQLRTAQHEAVDLENPAVHRLVDAALADLRPARRRQRAPSPPAS